MQAYVESPIYARTSGYLKKWYHDIGTRVRQGELLADIDTPEIDQQLSQSRAELGTAKANRESFADHRDALQGIVQDRQRIEAGSGQCLGRLGGEEGQHPSAEANVRRLEELESFKHIYAPFSGVITRRNVDIGNLINAGNGGSAQELLLLWRRPIRSAFSSACRKFTRPRFVAGLGAYLELQQYPGSEI